MGGGIYDVADGDAASTAGISYIPQFGDVASRERERRTRRRAAAHSAKERAASDFAERSCIAEVA
jgi:hypothetical protein